MKKITSLIISLFLLVYISACTGYKPIFGSKNLKFIIVDHSVQGDAKLGNQIYSKLYNISQLNKNNPNARSIRISIKVLIDQVATVKNSAFSDAAKFLTGDVAKHTAEGAFNLGIASSVGAWQLGVNEMLQSGMHGAVTGGVFRGIANLVNRGGIPSIDPKTGQKVLNLTQKEDQLVRMGAMSLYEGLQSCNCYRLLQAHRSQGLLLRVLMNMHVLLECRANSCTSLIFPPLYKRANSISNYDFLESLKSKLPISGAFN